MTHSPINVSVVELPNVGRCDHTYAYHIVRWRDRLAPLVLFLKANSHDSPRLAEIGRRVGSVQRRLTFTTLMQDNRMVHSAGTNIPLAKLAADATATGFTCGTQPLPTVSAWHDPSLLLSYTQVPKGQDDYVYTGIRKRKDEGAQRFKADGVCDRLGRRRSDPHSRPSGSD